VLTPLQRIVGGLRARHSCGLPDLDHRLKWVKVQAAALRIQNVADAPPRISKPAALLRFSMATLQIDSELPVITPEQSLTGWRREFCVELHGEGVARVFVRAVEDSSMKATELKRAILFHRLRARFADFADYISAHRADLERLADSAQRPRPAKDNLFVMVQYDRAAWERIQLSLNRWRR